MSDTLTPAALAPAAIAAPTGPPMIKPRAASPRISRTSGMILLFDFSFATVLKLSPNTKSPDPGFLNWPV